MSRRAFAELAGLAFVLAASVALAQEAAPRRIEIAYEQPKAAAHRPIFDAVREARVLETFQQALSPFRLPRTLTARIAGCDGEVNAFYENGVITVCYEYLDYVSEVARSRTTCSVTCSGKMTTMTLFLTNQFALSALALGGKLMAPSHSRLTSLPPWSTTE